MSQAVTKRVNNIIHVDHAIKIHLVSREKTLLRRKMAAKKQRTHRAN